MHRFRSIVLLLVGGAALLVASGLGRAEEDEPGSAFGLVVEIGAQTIDARLGEPFEVVIDGKPVRVRITAKPTARFEGGGIRFEYPRHMSLEVDATSPNVTLWTLDGNNVVLMLQQFHVPAVEAPAAGVAEEVVLQFGRANTRRSTATITLGGKAVEGIRLEVTIAGHGLILEFYDIPGTKKPTVLVVQDGIEDDGSHTDEWKKTVEDLRRTFRVDR